MAFSLNCYFGDCGGGGGGETTPGGFFEPRYPGFWDADDLLDARARGLDYEARRSAALNMRADAADRRAARGSPVAQGTAECSVCQTVFLAGAALLALFWS